MKDNFSSHSGQYAQFRPAYPQSMYSYLLPLIKNKDKAWDCGTGNGQVGYELAKQFKMVYATDISQSQLDNALKADNIIYSLQPAEDTNFEDQFFDLILVAQAIHWFDFDRFYCEVNRTLKQDGILAVVGYNLVRISAEIDKVILGFYEFIGKYWDMERKFVEQNYETIPFPFENIPSHSFENHLEWTFEHLVGYLNTWSAVKHYSKAEGVNPLLVFMDELKSVWGEEKIQKVVFPVFMKLGKKMS